MDHIENPGTTAGARDFAIVGNAGSSEHSTKRPARKSAWATFDDGNGAIRVKLIGRELWALTCLMAAGERGCTPIDTPGPRWSHYVWLLRGHGLDVETITEDHGGPFWGTHARYILRTTVRIEEVAE